jgi:RNA-directed DNA polymerase
VTLETPDRIRELQRKLYRKAKQEKEYRFYLLYDKVYRRDILSHAYRLVRANKGAPGVDGETFEDIEKKEGGVEGYLEQMAEELRGKVYRPMPVRRVYIPKPDGSRRSLGIPTIKDRVVQMAVKLVIEPIFEADFEDNSYGFRPKRDAHQAMDDLNLQLLMGRKQVIDADISKYLETSSYCTPFHERLSKRVAWIPNTLIYNPFRFPARTWTAAISPRFTRCNTVWRETPRSLVASSIDTWPSGTS